MGHSRLVSVVVPAYNVEPYIEKTLRSILNQTYREIEIIVVADIASSDNTVSIVEKIIQTYNNNRIKLIKVKNFTPAINRNIGIAHSRGAYIAFCDGDDYFAPEKIALQVNSLERNPNVGVVYTDYIVVDEEEHEIKRIRVPDWNKTLWLRTLFTIPTPSIMVRREILMKISSNNKYFDESLYACEDLDLLIRLAKVTDFGHISSYLTYCTERRASLSKKYMLTITMASKVLLRHKLYYNLPFLTASELGKMLLRKISRNPQIGYGLFFSRIYDFYLELINRKR